MKLEHIPEKIDPSLNLEQIREECLDLVKKRAYFSAGAAVIPVPFLDVVIDVGILSQLIPEINARFGLTPEQVSVYDPETKQIHWSELRKRGVEFSGLVVARTAVKKSLNNMAAKYITKQVTKFIPLGTGSQRFIPQHINKIGQYYLRETVGHIFSGRGDSDFQQVFQLDKREGAKIG
jgi:hypothetical protein